MSQYLLYGTELIQNDNTLKDFATCVYNNCPLEAIVEDGEERKDFIMDIVKESLEDDISRTDIDYEDLLYRYRSEIGDILYQIDNNGIPMLSINFFRNGAKEFFNDLVYWYIDINYEEYARGKM